METKQEFKIVDEPIDSFTKIKFYNTYLPKIPKNTSQVIIFDDMILYAIYEDHGSYLILSRNGFERIIEINFEENFDISSKFGDILSPQEYVFNFNRMVIIKGIKKLHYNNFFEYDLFDDHIKIIRRPYERPYDFKILSGSTSIATLKSEIKNGICIPYYKQVQTKGAHRSHQ